MIPRYLLWMYPAVSLILGLTFWFGDQERTNTASFEVVKIVLPVQAWGSIFMLGFVAMSFALTIQMVPAMYISLFVGGAIFTFWAVCFALSAIWIENASLNAWALYALGAYAHFVSASRLFLEDRHESYRS